MSKRSDKKILSNVITYSLNESFEKYESNQNLENFAELMGAIIIVNSEENYTPEIVNETRKIGEKIRNTENGLLRSIEFISIYSQSMEEKMSIFRYDSRDDKKVLESRDELERTILFMYANDLVELQFLVDTGLIYYLTSEKLIKAKDEGRIDDEKVIDILTKNAKGDERYNILANLYNIGKSDKTTRKMAKEYLTLIPDAQMARLYGKGILSEKELWGRRILADDVLSLSAEDIIDFLKQKQPLSAETVKSDQLLDLYIKKFSGEQLIKLAEMKKVDEENIITLASNKSAVYLDEEKAIKPEEILEFYNAERLLKLLDEGKINSRFTEIFNKDVIEKLPENKVKEYYDKLINDIKTMESEAEPTSVTEKVLKLYNYNILPGKEIKENIENFEGNLEILFLDEKIDDNTIAKLFNENLISINLLKTLYNSDQIMNMYNSGKINSKALMSMDEEERSVYLYENIYDQKNETKTVLELYSLYDGISIEEVVELLKDTVEPEEIYEKLPRENLKSSKVKELFINYLISQDELAKLRDEKIITPGEYKKFSEDLDKAEFFKKLKEQKLIVGTGVAVGDGREKTIVTHNGGGRKPEKISFETRRKTLEDLGGKVESSIDGKGTSFHGYSIVGFEDDGLVIFENFDSSRNATYTMTYQQAMYFIQNIKIANSVLNSNSIVSYTGTKQELQDTENVRRRIHTKNWAKNVVDSMSELSENAKSRLKPKGKYQEKVRSTIKKVAEEYEFNS